MTRGRSALLAGALALAASAPARLGAQDPALALEVPGVSQQTLASEGLVVAVDGDDDDENGVVDARQRARVPEHGLLPLRVEAEGPFRIDVEGPLRVIAGGEPLALPATLSPQRLERGLGLQGTSASSRDGDAALVLSRRDATLRIPVTVLGVALLDARNEPVDARTEAVGLSHRIANDASLPRVFRYGADADDPDNVRIEVFDPTADGDEVQATLQAVDPDTGVVRWALDDVPLRRPEDGAPFRSPWLRLVGDEIDARAPGMTHRLLRVGLRDAVRVRYETGRGTVTQRVRVGRPGDEDGSDAARRAALRIRLLRVTPGGAPVVGEGDASAQRLARDQIGIANEIWLQCFVGFGEPARADVAILDPPPPSLLAVANDDGLPAAGGGTVRFRIDGRPIEPVQTLPGAPPVATALAIAGAVREAGFRARVTENASTEHASGRSADVLVRREDGSLPTLSPDGEAPLGSDARQTVEIGQVDLTDGLQEFGNMNATAGTLEERALLKALQDDDPTTVDLFVVNHFTGGTRQGEAFIEGDAGAIVNAVILDRNGLKQQRSAWTQSHEVGHVLLDQPYHPDNVGPDRPWLLMDADTSLPLVTGPKRLTENECHRVRAMSGVEATPALLSRTDAREQTPEPPDAPFDRGYPRP